MATEHIVKEGDTLAGIALQHNLKLADLKLMNHLFGGSSDTIYKGQRLNLCSSKTSPRFAKRGRSQSLPPSAFEGLEEQLKSAALNDNITDKQKDDDDTHSALTEFTKSPDTHLLPRCSSERLMMLTKPSVPKLVGGSSTEVLTDETYNAIIVPSLEQALPRHNRGYDWKLLYSLQKHGASLGTLYRNVYHQSPTIIVIETAGGDIFGGFASKEWNSAGGGRTPSSYYGNGECFLFSTAGGKFKDYQWTMSNSMFMFSNEESLAMGGGGGFGLFLNSDMSSGCSKVCATFNNPPLASTEDFEVVSVEVWGFVTKR